MLKQTIFEWNTVLGSILPEMWASNDAQLLKRSSLKEGSSDRSNFTITRNLIIYYFQLVLSIRNAKTYSKETQFWDQN